ncbi:hypothetical protein ABZ202_28170 [Streptomyces sp. NPDC006186]|uniref:hypothetical protein n=1 Tax=Streptomyces sp. NPDC006186 TaxID=3155248 RepID=UPI0033B49561
MWFVSFVLFVDDETAVPGYGVAVYAAEGTVVEHAHAAGGRGHDVEDAVDGDGGLSAGMLVGHVAGVEEDPGEVAFVFSCGEEDVFGSIGFVSAAFPLRGGCGIDAVVANFPGLQVDAAAGPGEGGGFVDGSVRCYELVAPWAAPRPGFVVREDALCEGLVHGEDSVHVPQVARVVAQAALGVEPLGSGRPGVRKEHGGWSAEFGARC